MSLLVILLLVFLFLSAGGATWYGGPNRGGYGYAPGGVIGLVLIILIVYLLFGGLH